jgi:5-methylcytosine-specific restriction endonuclease McrA
MSGCTHKNTRDVELLSRGIGARDKHWRHQRGAESGAWRQRYESYLQTDEWRERRRLVMQRAGGICEGCRQEPATEVHHLTYKHAGREFLWELVAICRRCDERYHEVQHG